MEFSDRVASRLGQAISAEGDRWRLDDLTGALQIVLLAAKGSPIPHIEAYYRAFGVHPDKLWQKIDAQTGKTIVWFLFVERGGAYEGVAAKLFPRPSDGSRWPHSLVIRRR